MKLLHFIGLAWGVGGATVAAILMRRSEKDPEAAPHLTKLMPAISKLIWIAIILLVISGIGIVNLVYWPIDTTMLAVKHVVVLILILNGLHLTFRVMPKMERLVPKGEKPSADFLKARKNAKVGAITGLVLWYIILVLSVIT